MAGAKALENANTVLVLFWPVSGEPKKTEKKDNDAEKAEEEEVQGYGQEAEEGTERRAVGPGM